MEKIKTHVIISSERDLASAGVFRIVLSNSEIFCKCYFQSTYTETGVLQDPVISSCHLLAQSTITSNKLKEVFTSVRLT